MGHKAKDSLGQALIRNQHSHKAHTQRAHTLNTAALESVVDVRDLDAVVEQAELAGRVFSSVNPLPEVLVSAKSAGDDTLSPEERKEQQKAEEALYETSLRVPRRPKWHNGMTPEELDIRERQSFLNWRRELARLEANEKLVITPFEKNLDIWKQLWRVIERSDLVVMVVDARNPLFYRCPDLEAYVKEIDTFKRLMLLVNKADLLPKSARLKWSEQFKSQGISFLFWSAKAARDVLEGKGIEMDALRVDDGCCTGSPLSESCQGTHILSTDELLDQLQSEAEHILHLRKESVRDRAVDNQSMTENFLQEEDGNDSAITSYQNAHSKVISRHAVVGFVGYPNVGKSSTINALLGEKKTGVTSTPGKTKHFQTFIISENLILCDCPGLVFPSFTSSRSDMVASGVLPIDKLTDHRGPIQAIADLVPRIALEKHYGISLPKPKPYEPQDRPPTAYELLKTFCQSRGYVASAGLADETRAARQILKDYVSGKLLFYHLPPTVKEAGSMLVEVDDVDSSSDKNDSSEYLLNSEVVMDHLNSFETIAGMNVPNIARKEKNSTEDISSHKMHKKTPRKKDRSWRSGNDDGDGMPVVKGVMKP